MHLRPLVSLVVLSAASSACMTLGAEDRALIRSTRDEAAAAAIAANKALTVAREARLEAATARLAAENSAVQAADAGARAEAASRNARRAGDRAQRAYDNAMQMAVDFDGLASGKAPPPERTDPEPMVGPGDIEGGGAQTRAAPHITAGARAQP